MKNSTIRILFILALLSAAGIIATQVYWVHRADQLEDKEFNLKVKSALRTVANDIWQMRQVQPQTINFVKKINPDYYIVDINEPVTMVVVGHFLKEELANENLNTDFIYGMYDCMSDSIPKSSYVKMNNSKENTSYTFDFPKLKSENYYFGVFFPKRQQYINAQLSIWTASSFVLLLVLFFLGYIVFLVFKQKRLSEVQKDFVNNMTHEFKTPLAAIQISSEVLKNPKIVNNPQRLLNYATIINNEAVLLTQHVERVLQMAHAEKGAIPLTKTQLIWQELISEAAKSFENHHLPNEKLHIILDMPDKPIVYIGDRLHLKNVINNLIDNAIKYCEDNCVINIHLKEIDKTIEVSVRDNGIGIDKKYHKMLFKRFFRVPKGNVHNVKGFGLGLNYVFIITKAHNGNVECESELGIGSKFILKFYH